MRSSSSTVKASWRTKGTSCWTRKRVRRATATGCESRWKDRARSPISSMAKKAQLPTTSASLSGSQVTPPSNSSEPWARSWSSWSLARRCVSSTDLHAFEDAVGGHLAKGLLVGGDAALDVGVAVHRGDPAVVAGAVHPFVQQRAGQQMIQIAAALPVEAGQPGLALERDVEDRRLAEARAGDAGPLHRVQEPRAQLVARLVGARVERSVADQLEGGDGRGGRDRVRGERAGLGHARGGGPRGAT